MDIKEIKHYLKLMDAYGLCEFTMETADGKISLKRPQNGTIAAPSVTTVGALQEEEIFKSVEIPAPAAAPAASAQKEAAAPKPQAKAEDDLVPINSRYTAPRPSVFDFSDLSAQSGHLFHEVLVSALHVVYL